jgi:hypothetical protein
MKTVREWFTELPEEYRLKLKEYIVDIDEDQLLSSPDKLLMCFDWSKTEEGFHYWRGMDKVVRAVESDVVCLVEYFTVEEIVKEYGNYLSAKQMETLKNIKKTL